MSKRTIRDFTSNQDIWPIIDTWAQAEQFDLIDSNHTRRLYQKGRNVMNYPVLLEISHVNEKAHFEMWVQAGLFDRTRALFMVPSEMGIESGGLQMAIPRRDARQSINKLLVQLKQPPIS